MSLERQLKGFRLTTTEIIYQMPDYPHLVQSFIWQEYDLAPDYPMLRKFLEFWMLNLEGEIVAVDITTHDIVRPPELVYAESSWSVH